MKIWSDHHPFELRGVLAGHSGDVTAVEWCRWRRDAWITAADDRTFRLWDPDTRATLRTLAFAGDVVTAACVDAVNRCFLAATADAVVRVYDASQLTGDDDDRDDDEPAGRGRGEGKGKRRRTRSNPWEIGRRRAAFVETRLGVRERRSGGRACGGSRDVPRARGRRVASRTSPVDDSTSPPDATGRFACGSRRTTRGRAGFRPTSARRRVGGVGATQGGFESAFERERPLETPSCLQFEDPVTKMLAKEAARAGADARRDAEQEEARERKRRRRRAPGKQ